MFYKCLYFIIDTSALCGNDLDDDELEDGTIFMDAEGNYYYQSGKKAVQVKPVKKDKTIVKEVKEVLRKRKKCKSNLGQIDIKAELLKWEDARRVQEIVLFIKFTFNLGFLHMVVIKPQIGHIQILTTICICMSLCLYLYYCDQNIARKH